MEVKGIQGADCRDAGEDRRENGQRLGRLGGQACA